MPANKTSLAQAGSTSGQFRKMRSCFWQGFDEQYFSQFSEFLKIGMR
jgi:hypothetical protein